MAENNLYRSSIIDTPRQHTEADLFGIEKYQNALADFIKKANTPLTIALQGEWGSGKTSLMNVLQHQLCEEPDSPLISVWINKWHQSLLRNPAETILNILESTIAQIGEQLVKEDIWGEKKKRISATIKALQEFKNG